MEIGKKASEDFYKETGKRPLMHPFHFGTFFEVFSCCKLKKRLTDSIDFYSKNVEKLEAKMSDLRESTKKLPLGFVFITFKRQTMVDKLVSDYKFGIFSFLFKKTKCFKDRYNQHIAKSSCISSDLRSDKWRVRAAW